MSRVLRVILIAVVGILAVLCLLVLVMGPVTVRRSFPQVSGEVKLTGLDAPVEIYRDSFGIPHIYASSEHDLFFAEGYVHAQDRFWQMDFWRHIGSGRLSEMFGKTQVDTDKFLRTLGWARVAQQELDALEPGARNILEYYTEGVNAYLVDHQGADLSFEYVILKLLNPSYKPEPWQPLHSMTWAKVMAWDLGGNMDSEIERAILSKTLSPQQIAEIFPLYPSDHPVIVPTPNVGAIQPDGGLDSRAALAGSLAPMLESVRVKTTSLETLLGPLGAGIGSNNWVLSGKRTNTGKPLLANDPHLGEQMPSIWYEIGLHCVPKSDACPYEVTGFSFAGAPGVIIGHNDRIAWGFTNVGPDVEDLYIERINPNNPDQYEVNGQWKDMQIVKETIQVSGDESVKLTVRYTRHGPIISDTYGSLKDFSTTAGIQLPAQYAIALRWTALDPTTTFPAIWKMDMAQNWDQFRKAAQEFDVPSQNLVFADVDGNIGYQTPGKIPLRAKGDGTLPVPGWTDEYEWAGFIPFEKLPYAYNPPQGYIATANNAVVGPDYPYLISSDWDYGFRAQRIVDMIENAPGPIDIPYIQKMQGDDMDLNAETLVPVLLEIPLEDANLENTRAILQGWDFQATMDSAPAALFEVFWKHLLADTFDDNLPEAYWPDGGDKWFEVMRNLMKQPESAWWDNKTTPEVEGLDQIFAQAFTEAVSELESKAGDDPTRWKWGDLHTVTFINATLGESGIAPIEALFNRGPFPTSGGESIVNATGWNSTESYTVDWLPSMRMIVDLSNLQNSLTIHTTGESGHAFNPHYIDMADLWRTIQYHPMLWDEAQVKSAAGGHLTLAP
jgi:penicillin G amidase